MLTGLVARALFTYKEGELYWNVQTCASRPAGSLAGYSKKDKNCRIITVNSISYKSQDLIYLYHNNRLPLGTLTYIDGDPMNNRIENLRDISVYEYYLNHEHPIYNPRIEYIDKLNTFEVVISLFGNDAVIGRFPSHEEALSVFMGIKDRLSPPVTV
jgi:hypothetical protein